MTRARNLAGLSTVTAQTTTTTPVNLGPLGVVTATTYYGTFDQASYNAVSVATTSLVISGITTGLNVSGIATFQNGVNIVGVTTISGELANINCTGIATFAGNVSIAGTLTYEDVTDIDSVGLITARTGLRVTAGGIVVTAGVSTFADDVVFTGAAANVTWDKSTDDLIFNDNAQAKFGTGGDLSIYHDPAYGHSFIKESGSGGLILGASVFELYNAAISEKMITATADGPTQLYHDNTLRLATTTTGISITNDINVAGLSTFSDDIYIADKIIHSGDTNTQIRFPTNDTFTVETAGSEAIRVDSGGRLLIGTATTKSAGSGQYANLNVEGYAGGTECFVSLSRAEAASAMSDNDEVANLTFNDSAGYEFARIQVLADAATGATDTPGRMVLRTTADGASSSTERLRITSTGSIHVGGTTTATGTFTVKNINDSSHNTLECLNDNGNVVSGFSQASDGDGSFFAKLNDGTLTHSFRSDNVSYINNTQLFTIGATANYGTIGTAAAFQIQGTNTGSNTSMNIVNAATSNASSTCDINVWQDYRLSTRIISGRENASNWTSSASAAASYLAFYTNSAGTVAERLRIGSSGRTYINTTSPIDGNSTVAIRGAFGTAGCGVEIKHAGNPAANRDFIRFYNTSDAEAGSIEHDASTSVAYKTSSDYRLKENIVDITDGIERLKLLKPRKFSWIEDPEVGLRDGFIAHEVSPVIPHCVSGEKDAVKDNGKMQTQTMEYSQLTPLLTAALQEAIAEIETLKAKVAALESS